MRPVTWGILSTSSFAVAHMIPALKTMDQVRVEAIASRDEEKAKRVAAELGIPKAYGSYEELLADPEIEVVYNPLPNHMHVPWSIKAAEAGKHVLCEKPLALNAAEAETLLAARDRTGVVIVEAYVVRFHPQWRRVRQLVREGRIGEARVVQGWFSYMLTDAKGYRSKPEMGGGGLFDVGVYPLISARLIFETEPTRAFALIERDPNLGVDRLDSCILDFPNGQASFVCATQLAVHQHMVIHGTKGRIELPDPFAQAPDRHAKIVILGEREIWEERKEEVETLDLVDQYIPQAEAFCAAVRGEAPPEFPLEDSLAIMRVLDALFRSGESGRWEAVDQAVS